MNVLEKILEEIEEMRDIMESTVAMDCFGKIVSTMIVQFAYAKEQWKSSARTWTIFRMMVGFRWKRGCRRHRKKIWRLTINRWNCI